MFSHTRVDWAREMKKAEKPRDRHKAAPSMIFFTHFYFNWKKYKMKIARTHERREKVEKGLAIFSVSAVLISIWFV